MDSFMIWKTVSRSKFGAGSCVDSSEVSIETSCVTLKLFDGFPYVLSRSWLRNSLPFSSIEERYVPSSVIGAENMYRIFRLSENAPFRISSHWTRSKSEHHRKLVNFLAEKVLMASDVRKQFVQAIFSAFKTSCNFGTNICPKIVSSNLQCYLRHRFWSLLNVFIIGPVSLDRNTNCKK